MPSLELPIIYEDGDMMVINKPAGIVVNRAKSVLGETVADWADKRSEKDKVISDKEEENELFRKRSGVAHRLDKETSGCLLLAKNPKALTNLLGQFKSRLIKKEYLALVHGHLRPATGTVKLPLRRSRFDRERWEIHYAGKSAETEWRVEKYLASQLGDLSLVRLFPVTGRTHQIRVHFSHLGFPIVSDDKYLSKILRRADRDRLWHHFLHAEVIKFKDLDGRWQKATAPLPDDCQKLLSWIDNG